MLFKPSFHTPLATVFLAYGLGGCATPHYVLSEAKKPGLFCRVQESSALTSTQKGVVLLGDRVPEIPVEPSNSAGETVVYYGVSIKNLGGHGIQLDPKTLKLESKGLVPAEVTGNFEKQKGAAFRVPPKTYARYNARFVLPAAWTEALSNSETPLNLTVGFDSGDKGTLPLWLWKVRP